MPEARVPRIDVYDGHGGRELPLVAAAAVKVGPDPLDGAGVLVGAAGAVEGEGGVGVVEVPSEWTNQESKSNNESFLSLFKDR